MKEYSVELRDVTKIFLPERGVGEMTAVSQTNLGIRPGEIFTLLGPSGCGKTTTLRMIAGFETPSSGEIYIQDLPMSRVPPNQRPVNMVFQSYALFPHLNIFQNVAFGLAVKRIPKTEREKRTKEALELVRLSGLGDRKPSQLSGGQQQRVALARALINRPAVLLLDEPLGALDLKLRKEMQIELKHLQTQVGITFIYVTHDQEEALTLSDRIAVMNHGQILQVGDPVSIYEKPSARFVADFIGESNFLNAEIESITNISLNLVVAGERFAVAQTAADLRPGQKLTLGLRPEKLKITAPEYEQKNVPSLVSLRGVVREAIYIGTDTRYVVSLASGETVTIRAQNVSENTASFAVQSNVRIWFQTADTQVLRE